MTLGEGIIGSPMGTKVMVTIRCVPYVEWARENGPALLRSQRGGVVLYAKRLRWT